MGCRCGGDDCAIVQFTATQDTVTWSPIERIVETQAGNPEDVNKGS